MAGLNLQRKCFFTRTILRGFRVSNNRHSFNNADVAPELAVEVTRNLLSDRKAALATKRKQAVLGVVRAVFTQYQSQETASVQFKWLVNT